MFVWCCLGVILRGGRRPVFGRAGTCCRVHRTVSPSCSRYGCLFRWRFSSRGRGVIQRDSSRSYTIPPLPIGGRGRGRRRGLLLAPPLLASPQERGNDAWCGCGCGCGVPPFFPLIRHRRLACVPIHPFSPLAPCACSEIFVPPASVAWVKSQDQERGSLFWAWSPTQRGSNFSCCG